MKLDRENYTYIYGNLEHLREVHAAEEPNTFANWLDSTGTVNHIWRSHARINAHDLTHIGTKYVTTFHLNNFFNHTFPKRHLDVVLRPSGLAVPETDIQPEVFDEVDVLRGLIARRLSVIADPTAA